MIDVSSPSRSSECYNTARTTSIEPAGTEPFADLEALRCTASNLTVRTTSLDLAGTNPFAEFEAPHFHTYHGFFAA